MDYKVVGKSEPRWDACAKAKGTAEYTADLQGKKTLYSKICRATIAHGMVTKLDISEALKMPGVVKILTPDDVSQHNFSTAGHPYAIDPKRRDISDRNILTKHVRLYGDEIAAVIANSEFEAELAVKKIRVEYEEYPFYLDPKEALKEGAKEIHEGTKNLIAKTQAKVGDIDAGFAAADRIFEKEYSTQIIQHCHMENQIAYAYQSSDGRWVCVSSTQIPHIVRRILGEAFDMPWSKFRVIKPFIGGGFGNKQDIVIEPLVVAMSMAVGGRRVVLDLTREEVFSNTKTRHAISYKVKMGVTNDGKITAAHVDALTGNGGYAAHGHSICAKGGGHMRALYDIPNFIYDATTVYTNVGIAGAMRGYGIPQLVFMMESHMDHIAREMNFDKFEFRIKNHTKVEVKNPITNITPHTNELAQCFKLGKEIFKWDEKMEESKKHKTGNFRIGLGFASFAYATGVYPIALEVSSCRLVLNQDGMIKMLVGATEIGQGSDTVFSQMVAETVGVKYSDIIADMNTDTDYAPFDPGSYASRQTYVSGKAVRKASELLRDKILDAAQQFEKIEKSQMDIVDSNVVFRFTGKTIIPLADLAIKAYYDLENGECLTADVSNKCHDNAYAYGVTFAQTKVDIKTGVVEVLSMLNVHDSGQIINPMLAQGQVEGGMGMGVGYALSEQMLYDPKTGKLLNDNLLDYKIPTFMDIPDLQVAFVEPHDPTGPYGNKALGEPPLCSPAGAIRNAVVDATNVEINKLPLSPQNVFQAMVENNII